MSTEDRTADLIASCPFCGHKARFGLSKVWHDQLHGEPHQDVLIWCGSDGSYDAAHARIRSRDRERALQWWNTRVGQ